MLLPVDRVQVKKNSDVPGSEGTAAQCSVSLIVLKRVGSIEIPTSAQPAIAVFFNLTSVYATGTPR